MAQSAASRVFAIPELLEKILDEIPRPPWPELSDPQLFVLQRVNLDFYGTINGSPRLHERMYRLQSPEHFQKIQISLADGKYARRGSLTADFFKAKAIRAWKAAGPDDNGSWRRIKIAPDSAPIPIVVYDHYPSPYDGRQRTGKYTMKYAMVPPDAILGDLLDLAWLENMEVATWQATLWHQAQAKAEDEGKFRPWYADMVTSDGGRRYLVEEGRTCSIEKAD